MFLTPSTTPSTASFASSATSLTLETTFSAALSFSSSLSPINFPERCRTSYNSSAFLYKWYDFDNT